MGRPESPAQRPRQPSGTIATLNPRRRLPSSPGERRRRRATHSQKARLQQLGWGRRNTMATHRPTQCSTDVLALRFNVRSRSSSCATVRPTSCAQRPIPPTPRWRRPLCAKVGPTMPDLSTQSPPGDAAFYSSILLVYTTAAIGSDMRVVTAMTVQVCGPILLHALNNHPQYSVWRARMK